MPRKRVSKQRRKSVRNTVKHRKRRGATRRRRRTHRGGRSLFQRGGGGPAGGPAPGPAYVRVAGLPTPTGEEAAAMEKRVAEAMEARQRLEEYRKQTPGARAARGRPPAPARRRQPRPLPLQPVR